jgi:thiol-disulfide isomerase/thioredoxin
MIIIKNREEYNNIINNNDNVLIYCGLINCPPCKIVSPHFEDLDNKLKKDDKNIVLCKIIADDFEEIKTILNLKKFPVFTIIKDKIILTQLNTSKIIDVLQLLSYLDI